MSPPRRNYDQIIQRLATLPRKDWRVRRVSTVWNYPWFTVERVVSRSAPTVLLTAGIHGEEPATVEGALRWLEHGDWAKWRVNWLVLPCINPYGWERNQRRNAQGRDLNRQFRGSSDCPEVKLIKRLMLCRRFLFLMDFHEDVGASGYYAYELSATLPLIGERIVKAVGKVIPINRDKVIDGRQTTGLALIRSGVLKPRPRWPMAYHLFLNCTTHVLGSETPVQFPLEQCVTAHNVALRTALGALAHRR